MTDRLGKWCLHVGLVAGFVLGVVVGFYTYRFLPLQNFLNDDTQNLAGLDKSETDVNEYIIVDLSGAVNKPGVYKLLTDSRVADLLKIGEGMTNEASAKWLAKNVNLSQTLSDGDKVYVPFEWEVAEDLKLEVSPFVDKAGVSSEGEGESFGDKTEKSTSNSGSNASEGDENNENDMKINVNTATSSELETLPGIGPVTASRIINNRPYMDINDLKERASLSDSVSEKIKNSVIF